MPEWFVPVVIAIIASLGTGGAVGYLVQKRNIDMKAKSEQQSSIVDDTKDIRDMYRDALKDTKDKHTADELEWQKERARLEGDIKIKDALLNQSRQTQADMLVTIDDLKKAVNKVGDDVNKATGDFGKWELAGDRQQSEAYGRRASDKPKNGE